MEAIDSRNGGHCYEEAVASRLEAIASRMEAIASRMEAIAISRLSLLGWRPLLLGGHRF